MAGRRRSMLVSLAVAATIGVGLAPVLAAAQVGAAARPGNVTIYLAPVSKGGKDGDTGLTSKSPILTLAHAQQVLTRLNPPATSRSGSPRARTWPARSRGRSTCWATRSRSCRLTTPAAAGRRAGIRCSLIRPAGACTSARRGLPRYSPCPLPAARRRDTGLRFYYLAVEDYTQGISSTGRPALLAQLDLLRPAQRGREQQRRVRHDVQDIGDRFAPSQTGYGAILFTDSSHDDIYNNTFNSTTYNSGDQDQLHALYITHFSSNNTIDKNLFENTNGEAVKVRDRSNDNNVADNTFSQTGGVAAYLDDFCDQAYANTASPKKYRECASWGNRFEASENTIRTGTVWDLIPPGETSRRLAVLDPQRTVGLSAAGNKS